MNTHIWTIDRVEEEEGVRDETSGETEVGGVSAGAGEERVRVGDGRQVNGWRTEGLVIGRQTEIKPHDAADGIDRPPSLSKTWRRKPTNAADGIDRTPSLSKTWRRKPTNAADGIDRPPSLSKIWRRKLTNAADGIDRPPCLSKTWRRKLTNAADGTDRPPPGLTGRW